MTTKATGITCEVCFKEVTENFSNDSSIICQDCWEKSQEYLKTEITNVANANANDYGTAIGVAKLVSFVGWIAVIVGSVLSIRSLVEGGMALLGMLPMIGIAILGLLLVIAGQVSRAAMDNAKYSKEMLEIMKKNQT